MSNAVFNVSVGIGALSNANRPVFKVPSEYGGITLVGAQAVQAGVGTVGLYLVDLGSAGTAVGGTLGSFGTVYATNVPNEATLTSPFVDAGSYIGVKEANVGAANTVTIVSFQYVMGKAESA